MSKKVICENAQGQKLTIAHSFPFFLLAIEGIYEVHHTLTEVKGYGQDGVTSTGSTTDPRYITITIQIKGADHERRRDELYSFFQPKETGTFYYYEGAIARKCYYEVEGVSHPATGAVRVSSVYLKCADPLFYDLEEEKISLSTWKGNIVWPLIFTNPFSVAEKTNTLMKNVPNKSNTVLGVRIKFTAAGEVHDPQIVDVNRRRVIVAELVMHAGDTLELRTNTNPKRATLTHNGQPANVINTIAYPPQWPMLYRGDNVLRYDAAQGIDALSVDIFKSQAYWGC